MRILLLIASVFAPSCFRCGHSLRLHLLHIGRRRKDSCWNRCTHPSIGSPNSETCLCGGYVQE